MKIAVIGTGYVGLVAGAGFSRFGSTVTCVDIDETRIANLKRGIIPIHEPGLGELVQRNIEQGRLAFTTNTQEAVSQADIVVIAVGTPQSEDGNADMSAVWEAARTISHSLRDGTVVVIKSTVPVGTNDRVREIIAQETKHRFAVVSNPEFLKEGDAVNDFMKPARIILGSEEPWAIEVMRRLYGPYVRTNDRIQVMDPRSAELTKYAANAMLATRISFMNQMSLLAEKVGADIEQVRRGIGVDPRIGPKHLFPGPGFGGSCFPKDLQALRHTARSAGADGGIIEAVIQANERQKRVLGERIAAHFGDLAGRRIAVWGIAFKPETDDIRESPALVLIEQLLEAKAQVVAYDPAAAPHARARYGERITLTEDMYEAAEGADGLALVTEWHQFRNPDFAQLASIMRTRVAFDGRNIWNPVVLMEQGFTYYGIGRRIPQQAR